VEASQAVAGYTLMPIFVACPIAPRIYVYFP